jgi:solute carrier family 31 (copper transporter), member 1
MLFTWDTQDLCVVFRWWHVRGPWSLLFTLLGVVGLGMSYELLRNLALKFDESSASVRLASPNSDGAGTDSEFERGRRSPGIGGRYFPPLLEAVFS